MVNAQEWLDRNYPDKQKRSKIIGLEIKSSSPRTHIWTHSELYRTHYLEGEVLEGELNLNDFISLRSLEIVDQDIRWLKVDGLTELNYLYCPNNSLTKLIGLGKNLKTLNVNFCSRLVDLDIRKCDDLTNLEYSGIACYYLVSQVWELKKWNRELKNQLNERLTVEDLGTLFQELELEKEKNRNLNNQLEDVFQEQERQLENQVEFSPRRNC